MTAAQTDPVRVLNRMVQVLLGSFPVYLESTRPWSIYDPKDVCGRIGIVATDQRAMANRLIKKIHSLGAQVDPGRFPREFTAFNDLAIPAILDLAIQRQQAMIAELGTGSKALADYHDLASVVEEAVGNARGHLVALEELRNEL